LCVPFIDPLVYTLHYYNVFSIVTHIDIFVKRKPSIGTTLGFLGTTKGSLLWYYSNVIIISLSTVLITLLGPVAITVLLL